MSDGVEFDFTELRTLIADLGEVAPEVVKNVTTASKVTSINVKKAWQKSASRTGLSGYARDVSFDVTVTPGAVTSEIGPTPGDPGSLGIVEDAPGGVRSAPQHAGRDAARANEADFVKGIIIAATEIL